MSDQQYEWNRDFEYAAVRQLMADPTLLPQLAGVLRADRFPEPDLRLVVEAMLAIWDRTERVPTPVMVLQEAQTWVSSGRVKQNKMQDIASALEEAEELAPAATEYVLDQVWAFERKWAVWNALDKAKTLWKDGRFEDLASGVDKAAGLGRKVASPGLMYADNLEQRTKERRDRTEPPRWGCGVQEIDDCIRGGLAAGELGVVLGASGGGKSWFLQNMAVSVMAWGGSAVFYTLEMSEREATDRIDSAISGIPVDAFAEKAPEVEKRVRKWMERYGGAMVVKFFPSRITSCRDLKAHLQQLRIQQSFSPNVIVCDYGDLLAPVAHAENKYEAQGSAFGELRNLGHEFGTPVWTGSQAVRDAFGKRVITMADIADSIEKVRVSDVILALCRTEEEKQDEALRIYLAKVRYAADGRMLGPFKSDLNSGRLILPTGEDLWAI